MSEKSMFEKVWDEHIVVPETDDAPGVLYIDLHLIHEVTTPQAFGLLRDRHLSVHRPEKSTSLLMVVRRAPTRGWWDLVECRRESQPPSLEVRIANVIVHVLSASRGRSLGRSSLETLLL